jgi:hypothetical protein
MKAVPTTRYQCEICRCIYDLPAEAEECESRPVSQDKGVKVGDRVRITRGEGAGHLCEITSVYVLDRAWGHHAWDRYWHTVCVSGRVVDWYGSRMLTFDSYEVLR